MNVLAAVKAWLLALNGNPATMAEAIDALQIAPAGQWIRQSANLVLFCSDVGNTYSNRDAPGVVANTRPFDGANGDAFSFFVEAAHEFRVVAQPGQTIRLGGLVTDPGGAIWSTDPGSTVKLDRSGADSWVKAYSSGNWSTT